MSSTVRGSIRYLYKTLEENPVRINRPSKLSVAVKVDFRTVFTGFSAFIINGIGVSWIIIMFLPGIIIPPVLVLALGYTNEKRKRELYEFRDYGTVNGIKAKMIESDSNLDVKGNRKGL